MFSNRAAAYIKRKWQGDYYAALKDCVTALKLEPNHMKAHFRLVVCLYELKMIEDSKIYLDQFKNKFPSCKTSEAFLHLNSNILSARRSNSNAYNEGNHNNDVVLVCSLLLYILFIISHLLYYLFLIYNLQNKKFLIL